MIYDFFKQTTEKYGNNNAFVFKDKQITYNQSINEIQKIGLLFSNIQNKAIIIFIDKSEYSVLLQLAINKTNNVFIPIDSKTPLSRVVEIIEQTKPHYICSNKNIELPNFQLTNSYDSFNILANKSLSKDYPSNVTHLFFSSGSTGIPKGILLNDKSIPNVVLQQAKIINFNSHSKFAWLLSPSFDASLSDIYLTLFSGGELHICNFQQKNIKTLIHYFNSKEITHSDLSPSILHLIEPTKLNFLQSIIFGGEVGNEDIIKKWAKHVNMFNSYGPTEATISTSMVQVSNNWSSNNIGIPLNGVDYFISDDKELWISGEHLCIGYTIKELNDSKFINLNNKRYYKTADLVEYKDNSFFFIGRKDRQFKNNGIIISPEEIESIVKKLGCESALCSKKEKFELKYVGNFEIQEVRNYLEQKLPQNMIPQLIVKLDKLETNINGKIKI